MLKIILIEDNKIIAKQIVEFLSAHKWQVDYASTARQGVQLALQNNYDVALLDLNLPDEDGFWVCSKIRQEAAVLPGILMLTARDSFEDKAQRFRSGADDYLTKPSDLRELVLRCEALARRHLVHTSKIITLHDLEINLRDKTVKRSGQLISITRIGFRILEMLVHAYPQPLSRSYLLHQIWGDRLPDTDALKSHIYALRKAIDSPFQHKLIKTVLNVGFKLDFPDRTENP